jgi:hypothetical protein
MDVPYTFTNANHFPRGQSSIGARFCFPLVLQVRLEHFALHVYG